MFSFSGNPTQQDLSSVANRPLNQSAQRFQSAMQGGNK